MAARCCRTARRPRRARRCSRASGLSNEVDEDRTAVGAYIDLEANLTHALLASVAVRGEHYSDFGRTCPASSRRATTSTSTSRCAARCRTASARPRSSSSTSRRRRPTTSTVVPFEITTFPRERSGRASRSGAKDLDAEKSIELLARRGAALRRLRRHDGRLPHRHRRPHRAVGEPDPAAVRSSCRPGLHRRGRRALLHQRRGHHHRGRGRGAELSAGTPRAAGRFDFTVAANFTDTEVTKVPTVSCRR